MRKALLSFLLLVIGLCAMAQNQLNSADILQMKVRLRQSADDTRRLKLYHHIGDAYLKLRHGRNKADLDSAEIYFKKGLILSEKINPLHRFGKLEMLSMFGELNLLRGELQKAKAYFSQVTAFYQQRKDTKHQAATLARFVKSVYLHKGDCKSIQAEILQAVNLFKELKDINAEAEMYYFYAYIYISSDPEKVKNICAAKIKEYGPHHVKWIGKYFHLLSVVNRYQGNLDKSLFYALESIKWMKKTKDTIRPDRYYGELAQVYQELGQVEKSIANYKITLALREKEFLAQEYLYRTVGFIVQGLIAQNKKKEALAEVLGIEKRHKPDGDREIAMLAQVKGYCYEAMGNHTLAEKYYLSMIRLYRNTDDEINFIAKYDIGKFYVQQKKYKKASQYLADAIYNQAPASRKMSIYFLRHKIDSASGNFKEALVNYKLYKSLNDSIFNTAKIKEVEKLQVQYETNQKEQDIKLLKQEQVIQRDKLGRVTNDRNITMAGALVLGLFIALLYFGYRNKQKTNLVIGRKNEELSLLLDEKQWLIKEIHHRIKNNLQIVMALLQRQASYVDNPEALSALQKSEHRMHSIALIHQKLYQSNNLATIQLSNYIEELVRHLADSYATGSRIKFKNEIENVTLDVSQAVPLGLILNEAVTNAIKYAYPGNAEGTIYIKLAIDKKNKVTLEIRDDGPGISKGFNQDTLSSMGLNMVKGLARQLGGTYNLDIEKGVRICIIFEL